MNIFSDLLTTERTLFKISVKAKTIFETLASTFSLGVTKFQQKKYMKVFGTRKIGQHQIGKGVAIPHCRAGSCITPMGVLASLENEIDFDSSDGHPVNLLFALIVPYQVHQEHLDILSEVANYSVRKVFVKILEQQKLLDMHQYPLTGNKPMEFVDLAAAQDQESGTSSIGRRRILLH